MTPKCPAGQVLVDRLLIRKWRSGSTRSSKNYEVRASKSEWWFRSRCKEIMKEKYPDAAVFKMSDHWFVRFKARFGISLRRPTDVAQSHPETLRVNIQQFHRYIRRMAIKTKQDLPGKQHGAIGPWNLSDIANMDQTPLEFCFNTKGATYETKGEKTTVLAVAMRNANVLCS